MAMQSMMWPNTGVGDGAVAGYTASQTQRLFQGLAAKFNTVEGVFSGYGNECRCSISGANTIDVEDGICIVNGVVCFVEAESVNVPSGGGDGQAFVLAVEVDYVTQTGSLVVLSNSIATGATTIQVAGVTWGIPLCAGLVNLDGSFDKQGLPTGSPYSGINDLRRMIGDNQSVYPLRLEYDTFLSPALLERQIGLPQKGVAINTPDVKDLWVKVNLNTFVAGNQPISGMKLWFNTDSTTTDYTSNYTQVREPSLANIGFSQTAASFLLLPVPVLPDYHHLDLYVYDAWGAGDKLCVYKWYGGRHITLGQLLYTNSDPIHSVIMQPNPLGVGVVSRLPAFSTFAAFGVRR